ASRRPQPPGPGLGPPGPGARDLHLTTTPRPAGLAVVVHRGPPGPWHRTELAPPGARRRPGRGGARPGARDRPERPGRTHRPRPSRRRGTDRDRAGAPAAATVPRT